MKSTGEKVLINGHEYTLGERLGDGLEGAVFVAQEKPEFVIKLINTGKMSGRAKQELKEHLIWLKNTIGANSELKNKLAIPKALVAGDDLGYIMYRASEHESLKKYITFPTDVDEFSVWYKDNYNLKKRLQIASFLFNALESIHIAGLLFTDLSPNNIMVSKNKNNLVFIDTDNMRRKRDSYLSVVGTDGYMAPEIYLGLDDINKKLCDVGFDKDELPKSGRLSIESDVFSAAIIAFQLLTLQHPFIGDVVEDGTAEDESAALRCETDYILHENRNNESTTLPFVRFFDEYKIVTPKIKDLFYRTFVDGKNNPYLRPTALEFAEAFDEAQDIVVTCENCGSQSIYMPGQTNTCWDCETAIDTHVVLEIFDGYEEIDRNKLVAQILMDKPECEPGLQYKFVKISSVLLEEGKDKYLYLRHFERTTHRSKFFARITLIDEISGTVRLQIIDTSVIPVFYLVDRKTPATRYPIDDVRKGKEFSIDRFAILFDVNSSRVGKIKTMGMLSKK